MIVDAPVTKFPGAALLFVAALLSSGAALDGFTAIPQTRDCGYSDVDLVARIDTPRGKRFYK